jgi:hypothetical protein
MSQEWPKSENKDHLSDLAKSVVEGKESKDLDLSNKEMVIHGTFIENLESILRNGFDDSLSKRQYGGYGKGFASNPDMARSRQQWEDPFGRGLYFSRINGKYAYYLNNEYPKLHNLFDILKNKDLLQKIRRMRENEQNLRLKYGIPGGAILDDNSLYLKRLQLQLGPERFEKVRNLLLGFQDKKDPYTKKIQIAIKKLVEDWKDDKDGSINVDRNLTIFDFIDEDGQAKSQSFLDSKGKEVKFFYDKDGWMKIWRETGSYFNPKFSWRNTLFSDNYPIHLVVDSKFFSNYEYRNSIRYKGQALPPESIQGIIISLDTKEKDSLPDENSFDPSYHKRLTRRQYIPMRNRKTRKPKKIKREVLERFLVGLVKKMKRENPKLEIPIYDEQGKMLFSG